LLPRYASRPFSIACLILIPESLPAAIDGRMMFACLILSRGLSAQLAASGVQTCGRTSIGASRAHSPRALREFRLLLLPTGKRRNHDNIAQPSWVSPRPLSPVGTPQLMAPVLCPGRPGPFFRSLILQRTTGPHDG
jgi:hypothetical protein